MEDQTGHNWTSWYVETCLHIFSFAFPCFLLTTQRVFVFVVRWVSALPIYMRCLSFRLPVNASQCKQTSRGFPPFLVPPLWIKFSPSIDGISLSCHMCARRFAPPPPPLPIWSAAAEVDIDRPIAYICRCHLLIFCCCVFALFISQQKGDNRANSSLSGDSLGRRRRRRGRPKLSLNPVFPVGRCAMESCLTMTSSSKIWGNWRCVTYKENGLCSLLLQPIKRAASCRWRCRQHYAKWKMKEGLLKWFTERLPWSLACHTATLNLLLPPCRELNPVGSRALSHDSIFIPEEAEPCRDHSMSQENVSDKVRNLQVSHVSALTGWLADLCSYIYSWMHECRRSSFIQSWTN